MAEPSGFTVQSSRLPKEPLIAAALIVIVSVTLAVGGIVYKTRDSIQRDKVEFLADSNQKQVAPLRRVIQLRLAQDKARLIQFATTRSALGPGRSRVFGDFALVSLLTPTTGGQWGLSWIEKGPLYSQLQSAQAMVTPDQEIALLKSLPYDRIREGDIYWQRLSDSSGRPLWALAVSVETQASTQAPTNPSATALPEGTDYQSVQIGTGGRAVIVGFFGRNPLLSATEDFIGSTSTAFVIDSRGYAATHSNKTMVGSMLKDDPSVKEIFSARSSAGATRYQSPQGPKIFSAFEQVDRTNLYVVMSTPETVTASTGASFGRTAVTTGGLALVVGLFLVFAWGAKLLPRAGEMTPQPTPAGGGGMLLDTDMDTGSFSRSTPTSGIGGRPNAARAGVPGADTGPLELPAEFKRKSVTSGAGVSHASEIASNALVAQAQDRAAFVGRFVQGLERGMKEPLLAAMAHVQLVKVKAGDAPSQETMSEIAEHVTAVDRDLRRAKEMIDELSLLSSQSGTPTSTERADLNRLVTSVVDSSKAAFDQEGILLRLEASSVPLVRGREEPIRKVLGEVLKNAQRGLKSRSNKIVTVRLSDTGDTAKISVEDNGIGMDRETRTQAFDPFFHSFDAPDARGLGLAMVRSIVQSHGGTCELSSTPGDGTVVTLQWPVLASERESFSNRPVKVEMADVEHTAQTFSLDLSEEGANVLGGKTPLAAEYAASLPPSPRFGSDDAAVDLGSDDADEGDEKWSFGQAPASSALGQPASVSTHQDSSTPDPDKTEAVKIRPVRRG